MVKELPRIIPFECSEFVFVRSVQLVVFQFGQIRSRLVHGLMFKFYRCALCLISDLLIQPNSSEPSVQVKC